MPVAAPHAPGEKLELHAPTHLNMCWRGETLTLGEDIMIADRDFDAERVDALFTVTFGDRMARAALPYVERAVETKRNGSITLSLTHLALAGLPRLADPEAAKHRLLAADALMKQGVAPAQIVAVLTTEARFERA
jgi:hypothetical protein